MTSGNALREILSKSGILTLPGVYDALGARLVEQLGFEAVFTSGYSISGSVLGMPDYGLLTGTEVTYTVGRIIQSISIPLVADLDTGYGNPLNVIRSIKDIVQAGAAGVILEDQVWPKRCGHMEGKRVIALEEHAEKIRAAADARGDSGLVIIARTDARAVNGLDDAIARGRAYLKAGADVLFIEAPQTVDEIKQIAREFPNTWLFANMIEGGKTPFLSAPELEKLGFKIVVYPLSGIFAAAKAMRECFKALRENGSTQNSVPMLNFSDFDAIVDRPKFRALEKKYSVV